mmetsp:Transcript_13321/g.36824  ORF Transcript_13321/g.36824 Transcript_13321/m.36824 type:complete len:97 (-) Transcript_13321:1437-1727(-)
MSWENACLPLAFDDLAMEEPMANHASCPTGCRLWTSDWPPLPHVQGLAHPRDALQPNRLVEEFGSCHYEACEDIAEDREDGFAYDASLEQLVRDPK